MKKRKSTRTREKVVIHEPLWNPESDDKQFSVLFNWYNYNKSPEDAKKYFIDYLKDLGEDSPTINKIARCENIPLNNAIGWLCRIKQNCGEIVSTKYDDRILQAKTLILNHIDLMDKKAEASIKQKTKKIVKPSVQEYINNQLSEYLGELALKVDEYLLSEGKKSFDSYEWLKSNAVKHQQAKNIADYFTKSMLSELQEALDGDCEQLVEAYSFLTKSKLKKFIQFISDIVDNCNKWSDVAKQISLNNRAPRIRKPKPPIKQVAKLKFLREAEGLKSVPATSVVGSKTLITYNVKTRTLGMYVCNNAHGFSVKGSSLLNFDTTESVCRRLRKPEEVLPKISSGGKVAIRKLLEDLTTKEKKLNGRINGDTILLKVL